MADKTLYEPATVWFEVTGGTFATRIVPRLVSSESIAFVFHPNGRKSAKKSLYSAFFKTFEEAKQEASNWYALEIIKHEARLVTLKEGQDKILALQRKDIIDE